MAASRQLGDLDDACILHIFSFLTPLPDLFNIAGCCRVRRAGPAGAGAWRRALCALACVGVCGCVWLRVHGGGGGGGGGVRGRVQALFPAQRGMEAAMGAAAICHGRGSKARSELNSAVC